LQAGRAQARIPDAEQLFDLTRGAAVGVNTLPLDVSVEVDFVFQVG
jgi:hypothetical protein